MRAHRRMIVLGAIALIAGASRTALAAGATLSFSELYEAPGVLGMSLSAKTKALSGNRVKVLGYLAPPLKPEARFFVLTRAPVALCPFCNSDADWPSDIIVVYPRSPSDFGSDGTPVAIDGILELGSRVDRETGFVSLVRVVDATVNVVK